MNYKANSKTAILFTWLVIVSYFMLIDIFPSTTNTEYLIQLKINFLSHIANGSLIKFTSSLILASMLDIWLEEGITIPKDDPMGLWFKILIPIFILLLYSHIKQGFSSNKSTTESPLTVNMIANMILFIASLYWIITVRLLIVKRNLK